jgi:hypothetical protein
MAIPSGAPTVDPDLDVDLQDFARPVLLDATPPVHPPRPIAPLPPPAPVWESAVAAERMWARYLRTRDQGALHLVLGHLVAVAVALAPPPPPPRPWALVRWWRWLRGTLPLTPVPRAGPGPVARTVPMVARAMTGLPTPVPPVDELTQP